VGSELDHLLGAAPWHGADELAGEEHLQHGWVARSRPPLLDQVGEAEEGTGGGVNHHPELWNQSAGIKRLILQPEIVILLVRGGWGRG
jgi:hypothetical protein